MYRFSFDMGTNSLGWAVYKLKDNKPEFLENAGVRIYHDGRTDKDKTSLAQARTNARQSRRQNDRKLLKQNKTINFLQKNNLIPQNLIEVDNIINLCPYMLRSKAVEQPINKYELGRVLFALSQKRGFLSNRKQKSEKKPGQTEEDKNLLITEIGTGTLGQSLYKRLQQGLPVLNRADRNGLYTTREMYIHEFTQIKQTQNLLLSNNQWAEIEDILFNQRPLKPQQKGKCSLFIEEDLDRTYDCIPSASRFKILQDINNLKIITKDENSHLINKRYLTDDERINLNNYLLNNKSVAFSKLAKVLSIKDDCQYNLLTAKADKLTGSVVDFEMAKIIGKNQWNSLSLDEMDNIVIALIEEVDDIKLTETLQQYAFSKEIIDNLLQENWEKKLGTRIGRFSKLAYQRLASHLNTKKDLKTNEYKSTTEVIKELQTGADYQTLAEKLDYYAYMCSELGVNKGKNRGNDLENEYGFIANPTVHIGLNQLQKVTNKLIEKYGQPQSIIVEVARELKMNKKDKENLAKINKKRQENRNKIKAELYNEFNKTDLSREDYIRYQLWEELSEDPNNRKCPYTGKLISLKNLFNENSQIEVEHILPISKTLDDTFLNKILAYSDANKFKGNRSPAEAFLNDSSFNNNYNDILDRVKNSKMPYSKKQKFEIDAMKNWEDEDNGFLARQLKDTQYLSKISKKYLECICNDVSVVPGKLTSVLRHQWGLNVLYGDKADKQRSDHRHHAVDAIALGLCDKSTLYKASNASATARGAVEKLTFPCPIDLKTLQSNAKYILSNMLISHKINHKKQAQLHEETNYGFIPKEDREKGFEKFNLFVKKPLNALSEGEIGRIRSKKIRENIQNIQIAGGSVQDFIDNGNIKSVQVLVNKSDDSIKVITHKSKLKNIEHTKYVATGGNLCINLWKMPNGTLKATNLTYFDANKPNFDYRPDPNATKIMSLYKGDSIAWEENGKTVYGVVRKLDLSRIFYAQNTEASFIDKNGNKKSYNDTTQSISFGAKNFNIFREKNVRKVHIDELGQLKDSFNWDKFFD